MDEVIALEGEIMAALPRLVGDLYRDAQDILFNVWTGAGSRLERLRSVVAEVKKVSA